MTSTVLDRQFKNLGIDRERVLNANQITGSENYGKERNYSQAPKKEETITIPQKNQRVEDNSVIDKLFNIVLEIKVKFEKEIDELKEENKSLRNEVNILRKELSSLKNNGSFQQNSHQPTQTNVSREVMTNEFGKKEETVIVGEKKEKPSSYREDYEKRNKASRSNFKEAELALEKYFNFSRK